MLQNRETKRQQGRSIEKDSSDCDNSLTSRENLTAKGKALAEYNSVAAVYLIKALQ